MNTESFVYFGIGILVGALTAINFYILYHLVNWLVKTRNYARNQINLPL
jgi:hypothetical protein